jgi:predicted DNA-binding transcriptional regulator AlpA
MSTAEQDRHAGRSHLGLLDNLSDADWLPVSLVRVMIAELSQRACHSSPAANDSATNTHGNADAAAQGCYTAREVGELIRKRPKRVYELASRNAIPYRRIGDRQLVFPRSEIHKWLSQKAQ